jgi:hypothetical protein
VQSALDGSAWVHDYPCGMRREIVKIGTLAAQCATSTAAVGLYPVSAGCGLARACPSADASPHARSAGLSLKSTRCVISQTSNRP